MIEQQTRPGELPRRSKPTVLWLFKTVASDRTCPKISLNKPPLPGVRAAIVLGGCFCSPVMISRANSFIVNTGAFAVFGRQVAMSVTGASRNNVGFCTQRHHI
jgi:hypothetical protein